MKCMEIMTKNIKYTLENLKKDNMLNSSRSKEYFIFIICEFLKSWNTKIHFLKTIHNTVLNKKTDIFYAHIDRL